MVHELKSGLGGVLLLVAATGCEKDAVDAPSIASPQRLESVPAAVEPKVSQAKQSARELGRTLITRLTEAMAAGGPEQAVEVCASEAQALTQDVAKKQGVEMGRTSHRLRNPKNAPRPWVEPWLEAHANQPAASEAAVYDLGARVGVIVPIAMGPMCTTCHGNAVAPELMKKIRAQYPGDQATGFEPGDLRGAFWVEIPK